MERPLTADAAELDVDALLARVYGARKLLGELVALLSADCPRLLEQAREALQSDDRALLHRAGHTLKGMVANFCAPGVLAAATRLEALSHAGDPTEIKTTIDEVEQRLERLIPALKGLAAQAPP
jgi:two-component system sensor histidine kinase/response regulator